MEGKVRQLGMPKGTQETCNMLIINYLRKTVKGCTLTSEVAVSSPTAELQIEWFTVVFLHGTSRDSPADP